jgi:Na+/H+-dicarboxylate symporter
MKAAARIVLVLVAVTLACGIFAIAHGQAVGNVGRVGALMSPTPAGSSAPPVNAFGIVTEADAPLVTESDIPLETEAAP